MKYYKKINKKIETVEKYLITRIECPICEKDIVKDNRYCEVTLYPKYPEDGLYTQYCHEECLLELIKKEDYHDELKIEKKTFYEHEDDNIDSWDIEEKEEEPLEKSKNNNVVNTDYNYWKNRSEKLEKILNKNNIYLI